MSNRDRLIHALSAFAQSQSPLVEFERMAEDIRHYFQLENAYTLEEVMQACNCVCSHYAPEISKTMQRITSDSRLIRDFIRELGKVTATLSQTSDFPNGQASGEAREALYQRMIEEGNDADH